jgi:hypothetical protein
MFADEGRSVPRSFRLGIKDMQPLIDPAAHLHYFRRVTFPAISFHVTAVLIRLHPRQPISLSLSPSSLSSQRLPWPRPHGLRILGLPRLARRPLTQ